MSLFLFLMTLISISIPYGNATTTTTQIMSSENDTNLVIGSSNLYAIDSSAESDPSTFNTVGIVVLVSGAVLVTASIFIIRCALKWQYEREIKRTPPLSSWLRAKSSSLSATASPNSARTANSPSDGVPKSDAVIAPHSEAMADIDAVRDTARGTARDTVTALDGQHSPQSAEAVGGQKHGHRHSIGYIEGIYASHTVAVPDGVEPSKEEESRHTLKVDESMENEVSTTKKEEDPRDDPNWRSPTKQYRITVTPIAPLDGLEDTAFRHLDEERVSHHIHRQPVHSQSVSEFAPIAVDDEAIGNTFHRMDIADDDDAEEYPIDPRHDEDGHARGDTLETLVMMTDGPPITPPLPATEEDAERGHSPQSSLAESVHGFEAEESIEEDSDSMAVAPPNTDYDDV